jgi:hypothetical protein
MSELLFDLLFDLCLTEPQYCALRAQYPTHQGDSQQAQVCELFKQWHWEPTSILRGTRVYYDVSTYIEVVAPESECPEYLHLIIKQFCGSRFPTVRLDLTIDRSKWRSQRLKILTHAKHTIEIQREARYHR